MEADSCNRCSAHCLPLRTSTKLRLQPFWISAELAPSVSDEALHLQAEERAGLRALGGLPTAGPGPPRQGRPAPPPSWAHGGVQTQRGVVHLEANDSAMSPPVLISFSKVSLRRRGLSAMNSATLPPRLGGTAGAGHGPRSAGRPHRPGPTIPAPPFLRPTLARELGGGQAEAQHAAVANEAVLKVPNALIPDGGCGPGSVSPGCVCAAGGISAQSQGKAQEASQEGGRTLLGSAPVQALAPSCFGRIPHVHRNLPSASCPIHYSALRASRSPPTAPGPPLLTSPAS